MKPIFIPAAVLLLAPTAMAEETRQLGAHEHGTGALDIAIEGDLVEMALRAPGADIVGFEHPAESDADKAAVAAALTVLEQPDTLFRMPDGAGCTLERAHAELETGDDGEAHDHDEHEEGEHDEDHHDAHAEGEHDEDHHDEHAEDEHDEDHHDEHDHAAEGGTHSEFHAEATFRCATPDRIDRIEFGYFEQFSDAQKLEVQVVSDKGGFGATVQSDRPVLELK